ncbi:hypothetical protein ACFV3R_28300 [Streptomyces sp. NPDC059740]|uniref:hypothetical protein n=1 Tax=Streptomyces sp. NPDC059740 TaxID=3346926 RepID=UPI003653E1C2
MSVPHQPAATARPRTPREPGELFGPRTALFAEVLAAGVYCTLASLPVITAPTAFAAACRLLREAADDGRPATPGRYLAALRAPGAGRSLRAGLALLALATLLALDTALAGAGLPGAAVVRWVLAAVGAAALLVGVRAAADPAVADAGWRRALSGAVSRSGEDRRGTAWLAAALCLTGVIAWMSPPLALLAPGALAFAVTAVEARAAVREETAPQA